MKLVIVESPTKARTIGKFLGKDYEIKASMGHIIDLPKSKIGIDFEHDFAPQFEVIPDKKKIISELKSSAKSADSIILATDPDREGEAIAYHVAEILKGTTGQTGTTGITGKNSPRGTRDIRDTFKRIVFHEITKEAVESALGNPRSIDKNLVDAQTARRVLDRLVGYKLSPLLWKKVRRGLSAGRVQSVALRLIVEREREIEKFDKKPYFTIHATVKKDGQETFFDLIEINGNKIEVQETFKLYADDYKVTKTTIEKEEDAQKIIGDLGGRQLTVSDIIQKEMHRTPQPPYTTSTLQQDASRRLGINGRRTMSLAQKLYEEGFITYHRTDSVAISMSAQNSIRTFAQKEYGDKYLPGKRRFYATRQKLAQEAHEAIRPTRVGELQSQISNLKSQIGESYVRLYELIWRRAVASQMSDAIIESTTVYADAQGRVHLPGVPQAQHHMERGNTYRFKANGSVLVFDGFLKVNPLGLSDNKLPKFEVNEKLNSIDVLEKGHETLPPPRYNDASIIKTLEEKGIGRPSTYATIISTIESRQYIERADPTTLRRGSGQAGSGRGFSPTSIGIAVNDFLVKNFSDIDDIPFTASMEDSLDAIAHGQKEWVVLMKDFYTPFAKKLVEVEGAERVHIAVQETNEKCPTCGSPLVIRTGRFGKFLSCSTFPNCKFTKAFVESTGLPCPKCGSPVTPKPLAKGGEIVIKKTRRGRRFYGCSNYPKCDFAAWKLEDIKKPSVSS